MSYQFRHVTLDILSQNLDIHFVEDGVGRYVHNHSFDTYLTPDPVHPRLEKEKPWDTICAYRQLTWHTKHSSTALPTPSDLIPEREPSPVLFVYVALAVLQRAVHYAWAYVDVGGYERVEDAWHQDVVDIWQQDLTAQLARCPGAFEDVLHPRVTDACTKAQIGARSICGSMYARMLTRMHTAELFMMHRHLLRRMWTDVKKLHADIAAVEGLRPRGVPGSVRNAESGLGDEVRIRWPCC